MIFFQQIQIYPLKFGYQVFVTFNVLNLENIATSLSFVYPLYLRKEAL